jgi:acetyltransferase
VLKRRRLTRPDPGARSAIAFDLRDAAALADAVGVLERRQVPRGDAGLLVQRQVGRARELEIRVGEDAVFGPVIGFGLGGTAAAALHDCALDLPPLNLTLARALIERTRVAGAPGVLPDRPAVDIQAVAQTLVRVSQLLVDFPEIAGLAINPLFADAGGVQAADAWLRLRAAGDPPGRLAIAPYPAELTGPFAAGGETFTIRPIRPEDAEAHAAFFRRLPPEDIRYRFFSAMRELSAEQMARLTQVDYDREIAFLAVREATGETVGVARLVREAGSAEGEFAIVVQPDVKGRGLGRHLMQRLLAWGRAGGVAEVVGQILADNAPMLGFARSFGFSAHRLPDGAGVVEVRLPLRGG